MEDISRSARKARKDLSVRLPMAEAMQMIQRLGDTRRQGDFLCLLCEKSYKMQYQIREHIIVKHAEQEELPCLTCGKVYPNTVALRHHMKLHRSGKTGFDLPLINTEPLIKKE